MLENLKRAMADYADATGSTTDYIVDIDTLNALIAVAEKAAWVAEHGEGLWYGHGGAGTLGIAPLEPLEMALAELSRAVGIHARMVGTVDD